MKKRFLAMFLALTMCLALLPAAALAAEPVSGMCGDNLTWTLENGVLTISGTGAMEDYPYAEAPWYEIRSNITAVVIGQGVTSIGAFAFCECAAVTSVDIPNSVTSVGEGAFRECVRLTSVSIPDSVSKLGLAVFCGCTSLTSAAIPDSVTLITGYLFSGCTSLTAVTLPAGLTEIPIGMFEGCIALTGVKIPDSVARIGTEAFSGCIGLVELAIPDGVTEIGMYAFHNCTRLNGLAFPSGVTEFHSYTISGCTSLTRVSIGIGTVKIDTAGFSNCPNLISIDIAADNPCFASEDGVLFDKAKTTLLRYPAGKKGAYSVPEGVAAIGAGAFKNCVDLSAVTIPDGVTSIGKQAFQGCESLAEITAPDSVTSIGKEALEGTVWVWLKDQSGFVMLNSILVYYRGQEQAVTVPDGVTIIGPDAFVNCPELVSVTIPESVTSIDEVTELNYPRDWGALGGCWNLTDVFIENGDAQIGQNAFSWLQQMSMNTFDVKTLNVTVHAPSGGKVEAYCNEHQIKFVSTGAVPAPLPTVEPIPAAGTAVARTQTVKLDGKDVEFQCYAVRNTEGNETNYVKLRDLAQVLNGTNAQFDVGWDWQISITPNTPYQAVGGEGTTPYSGDQPYEAASDTPVRFDGSAVNLTSFIITCQGGGYTYYKLRDLGQLLNFNVMWDGSGIVVESDKPYTG